MGMERKDYTVAPFCWSLLDPADRCVAIFDGEREYAAHEGWAHALKLACRNTTSKHQPLGAAADGTVKRPDPNLAGPRLGKLFLADFSAARADIPKRFGTISLSIGHFLSSRLGLCDRATVIS